MSADDNNKEKKAQESDYNPDVVFITKIIELLAEKMGINAQKLGFNAEFFTQQQKYTLFRDIAILLIFAAVTLVIVYFLVELVKMAILSATAFSTILSVMVGVLIDQMAMRRYQST